MLIRLGMIIADQRIIENQLLNNKIYTKLENNYEKYKNILRNSDHYQGIPARFQADLKIVKKIFTIILNKYTKYFTIRIDESEIDNLRVYLFECTSFKFVFANQINTDSLFEPFVHTYLPYFYGSEFSTARKLCDIVYPQLNFYPSLFIHNKINHNLLDNFNLYQNTHGIRYYYKMTKGQYYNKSYTFLQDNVNFIDNVINDIKYQKINYDIIREYHNRNYELYLKKCYYLINIKITKKEAKYTTLLYKLNALFRKYNDNITKFYLKKFYKRSQYNQDEIMHILNTNHDQDYNGGINYRKNTREPNRNNPYDLIREKTIDNNYIKSTMIIYGDKFNPAPKCQKIILNLPINKFVYKCLSNKIISLNKKSKIKFIKIIHIYKYYLNRLNVLNHILFCI